jgi:hypothetical protein
LDLIRSNSQDLDPDPQISKQGALRHSCNRKTPKTRDIENKNKREGLRYSSKKQKKKGQGKNPTPKNPNSSRIHPN